MRNCFSAIAVASLSAAVVVAVALGVWWHDGFVPIASGCCSDHSYYLAMAGGLPGYPSAAHTPPFDYRILTPFIVRTLPLPATIGFHTLTIAALIGAGALLFQLLRTLGFGAGAAAGGILLFGSLYWLVEWPLMDYALVDPVSFFLAPLFLLALYRGRAPLSLGAVATIAVLNKEVGLILLPAGLIYLWRTHRLTRAGSLALVGAPIAAVVLVRLFVPSDSAYHPVAALQGTLSQRFGSWWGALHDMHRYFFPTWGPVLLVLAAQPQSLLRFIRAFPELALIYLLVHLQLLVAVDTQRVLVFAYVAVIPAILFALREGLRRDRLVLVMAAALAVAQGFYFEYTQQVTARFVGARLSFDQSSHGYEWPALVAVATIAVLIAAPVWFRATRSDLASESIATRH
jgi:hypothetical protein